MLLGSGGWGGAAAGLWGALGLGLSWGLAGLAGLGRGMDPQAIRDAARWVFKASSPWGAPGGDLLWGRGVPLSLNEPLLCRGEGLMSPLPPASSAGPLLSRPRAPSCSFSPSWSVLFPSLGVGGAGASGLGGSGEESAAGLVVGWRLVRGRGGSGELGKTQGERQGPTAARGTPCCAPGRW